MNIVPRSAWINSPSQADHDGAKSRGFIHHSAGTFGQPSAAIDTMAEQVAVMRALYDFHVHTRGWADIAYNFVMFQARGHSAVRIFHGRGGDRIPAAQLNDNTGTIAICVVDGLSGEPLKDSSVQALVWFWKHMRRWHGITAIGGHRDAHGQSTECPGPFIEPKVTQIAHLAGVHRL